MAFPFFFLLANTDPFFVLNHNPNPFMNPVPALVNGSFFKHIFFLFIISVVVWLLGHLYISPSLSEKEMYQSVCGAHCQSGEFVMSAPDSTRGACCTRVHLLFVDYNCRSTIVHQKKKKTAPVPLLAFEMAVIRCLPDHGNRTRLSEKPKD